MNITAIASQLMTIIGVLVALTNIVVQVVKQAIPNRKFPTNILAVAVALILTLFAFFAWTSWRGIHVLWYYVVAAVVLGFLVAYAAMFGFDKLKEVLTQMKSVNK